MDAAGNNTSPTQSFDFLALPRELRDAIHELALIPGDEKALELRADPEHGRFNHPYITITNRPEINWRLASKQIREEYEGIVRKFTTVISSTNGTWDLTKLEDWLPTGVTMGLLRRLQTWILRMDWSYWGDGMERKFNLRGGLANPANHGMYENALPKVLRQQEVALAGFMPERPCFTWEVDFTGFGELISTRKDEKEGFSIDLAKIRPLLETSNKKVKFMAHSPLYFDKTYTDERGKTFDGNTVNPWLVSSPECIRYSMEHSKGEGNIWGWAWTFENVYIEQVSKRTLSDRQRCSIRIGDWMPEEVYKIE